MIKISGNLGNLCRRDYSLMALLPETEVSIYSEIHGKFGGFSEQWILIPIDDSPWSQGAYNRVYHGEREES